MAKTLYPLHSHKNYTHVFTNSHTHKLQTLELQHTAHKARIFSHTFTTLDHLHRSCTAPAIAALPTPRRNAGSCTPALIHHPLPVTAALECSELQRESKFHAQTSSCCWWSTRRRSLTVSSPTGVGIPRADFFLLLVEHKTTLIDCVFADPMEPRWNPRTAPLLQHPSCICVTRGCSLGRCS